MNYTVRLFRRRLATGGDKIGLSSCAEASDISPRIEAQDRGPVPSVHKSTTNAGQGLVRSRTLSKLEALAGASEIRVPVPAGLRAVKIPFPK